MASPPMNQSSPSEPSWALLKGRSRSPSGQGLSPWSSPTPIPHTAVFPRLGQSRGERWCRRSVLVLVWERRWGQQPQAGRQAEAAASRPGRSSWLGQKPGCEGVGSKGRLVRRGPGGASTYPTVQAIRPVSWEGVKFGTGGPWNRHSTASSRHPRGCGGADKGRLSTGAGRAGVAARGRPPEDPSLP